MAGYYVCMKCGVTFSDDSGHECFNISDIYRSVDSILLELKKMQYDLHFLSKHIVESSIKEKLDE